MIVWIEKRLALAIHDRQVAEHGGSAGMRDENLLESALNRPQQLYAYGDPPPDLADLAATLAFGIARNHPFVDGNKRTAYVVYLTFLELNDAELIATSEEKYISILNLAEGKLPVEEFAQWLREHITTRHRDRVQDKKGKYKTRKGKKLATRK